MTELPDSVKTFSFDSYSQLLKFYEDAIAADKLFDALEDFPTVEEVVEVLTDEDYPAEGVFIGTPSV